MEARAAFGSPSFYFLPWRVIGHDQVPSYTVVSLFAHNHTPATSISAVGGKSREVLFSECGTGISPIDRNLSQKRAER
jgi:hypothetical protein